MEPIKLNAPTIHKHHKHHKKGSLNSATRSSNSDSNDRHMEYQDRPIDQCNVFVKYLPADYKDSDLYHLFIPFGEIVSCKVMIDHITKTSLGYGFVRFATPTDSQNAIHKLNGVRICNKVLLCKLSYVPETKRSPQTPTSHGGQHSPTTPNSNSFSTSSPTNLYVAPLPDAFTEDTLRDIFSVYGCIQEIKIIPDRSAASNIGFVRFEKRSEAKNALNTLNGKTIAPDSPPLIVKFAETESERYWRKAKLTQRQSPCSPPVFTPTTSYVHMHQYYYANGVPYLTQDIYGNFGFAYPMSPPSSPFVPSTSSPISETNSTSPFVSTNGSETPKMTIYNAMQDQNAIYTNSFPNNGNLFVFHLPPDIDDAGLQKLFQPFGALQSVRVMVDKITKESKGYGFVKYYRVQDAIQALTYMNGAAIGSKHLKVSFKTNRLTTPGGGDLFPESPINTLTSSVSDVLHQES